MHPRSPGIEVPQLQDITPPAELTSLGYCWNLKYIGIRSSARTGVPLLVSLVVDQRILLPPGLYLVDVIL